MLLPVLDDVDRPATAKPRPEREHQRLQKRAGSGRFHHVRIEVGLAMRVPEEGDAIARRLRVAELVVRAARARERDDGDGDDSAPVRGTRHEPGLPGSRLRQAVLVAQQPVAHAPEVG